jgi:hypothetical protein
MQTIAWLDHYDPEIMHLGTLRPVAPANLHKERMVFHCCSLHVDNAHDLFGEHIVDAVKKAGLGKQVWLTDIEVAVDHGEDI